MKNEKVLEKELQTNILNEKLQNLLGKIYSQERVIESFLLVLKNDENKQKMIEFLESGETDGDRIVYRATELNRGISLL